MSLCFNINGSNLIQNLLQVYEWQKDSLQNSSTASSRPSLNILYSETAYPPPSILNQFISDGWQDFKQRIKDIPKFKPLTTIYNDKGNLFDVSAFKRSLEPQLVSLWTKEDVRQDSGNLEKLEHWIRERSLVDKQTKMAINLLDETAERNRQNDDAVNETQKTSVASTFDVIVD